MTYATQQDLIDRFGEQELFQLTDRTNRPPSVIDPVVVDRALADAEALIDSYVGKAYTLPLASVPPILVKSSADVARYYLHGKMVDEKSPVTVAYNQALAWLKDVAKGLVSLPDDTGSQPAQVGGSTVRANKSTRVMRRDTLWGL